MEKEKDKDSSLSLILIVVGIILIIVGIIMLIIILKDNKEEETTPIEQNVAKQEFGFFEKNVSNTIIDTSKNKDKYQVCIIDRTLVGNDLFHEADENFKQGSKCKGDLVEIPVENKNNIKQVFVSKSYDYDFEEEMEKYGWVDSDETSYEPIPHYITLIDSTIKIYNRDKKELIDTGISSSDYIIDDIDILYNRTGLVGAILNVKLEELNGVSIVDEYPVLSYNLYYSYKDKKLYGEYDMIGCLDIDEKTNSCTKLFVGMRDSCNKAAPTKRDSKYCFMSNIKTDSANFIVKVLDLKTNKYINIDDHSYICGTTDYLSYFNKKDNLYLYHTPYCKDVQGKSILFNLNFEYLTDVTNFVHFKYDEDDYLYDTTDKYVVTSMGSKLIIYDHNNKQQFISDDYEVVGLSNGTATKIVNGEYYIVTYDDIIAGKEYTYKSGVKVKKGEKLTGSQILENSSGKYLVLDVDTINYKEEGLDYCLEENAMEDGEAVFKSYSINLKTKKITVTIDCFDDSE